MGDYFISNLPHTTSVSDIMHIYSNDSLNVVIMEDTLKKGLIYASAFSLAAMLIIVSFFSVSLKNVTVNQANKMSNLTRLFNIQSANLTQASIKIEKLEANISNLTNKLETLESKSNTFALQDNVSKSNISSYQKEVNSLSGQIRNLDVELNNLNENYNNINDLYNLVDRSLSYSLSKLSADNTSIFNLSSVIALKNKKILSLYSNISKLNSSLFNDTALIYNLSSELALKNQTISNLSYKLDMAEKYIYKENFIPSKITAMNINYKNSVIKSISQNGSNIAVVGNKTDLGYFVLLYSEKTNNTTNLTSVSENYRIANVFSTASNGRGFIFLVKFKNSSIGLVEYNQNLTTLTVLKKNFYPTGLSYSSRGYLITGYSKENSTSNPPPPPGSNVLILPDLFYYNLSNNTLMNLSSDLNRFKGYNLTNPVYNGTNYYVIGYIDPPGPSPVTLFKLSLLSYDPINNSLTDVNNMSMSFNSTPSQINMNLGWNGAYLLVSGFYTTTTPLAPPSSINYYNFLETYNPTTNLWANLTGEINTDNMSFTSNLLWGESYFITALSNSSESGLYLLNN